LPLDRALLAAVPITIFCFAVASSNIPGLIEFGRKARWAALLGLALLGILAALARADRPPLPAAFAAGAAFVALCFLSAAWSVEADLTLGRAASLCLLFAAAGGLALTVAGRPPEARALLTAVLLGAALVAFAGVVTLIFAYDRAAQRAYVSSGWRYNGFGYNANTMPMLLALAVPIGTALLLGRPSRRAFVGLVAALALIVASIAASGSRGALVAAFAGGLVAIVVRLGLSRRALAIAAVSGAVFAGGFVASQAAKPAPPKVVPTPPPKTGSHVKPREPRYVESEQRYFRLEDEIGRPATPGGSAMRTRFGLSGRGQAWEGAVEQAAQRPLLGYGFGTEPKVFVDRYYLFAGGTPENSYIGLFLQLGLVGLAALAAILGAALAAGLRAVRETADRAVLAGCAGACAAGLVLAMVQSYVYAVGNVATASFWICVFLLAATGVASRARGRA
jgi:O-antigen ligase